MTFSDFARILHPYLDGKSTKANFVISLTNLIIENPQDDDKEDINPFATKGSRILEKIYNGERPISKAAARAILSHSDKDQFRSYLLTLNPDIVAEVGKAMGYNKEIIDIKRIAIDCADLFESILDNCANGLKLSKELLYERIDRMNQENTAAALHMIFYRAETNNQIAHQLCELFTEAEDGYCMEDFIDEVIREIVASPDANTNENILDNINYLLSTIWFNCCETQMYDEAAYLVEIINEYIEISPSCPNEIAELREEILFVLTELYGFDCLGE